MNKYHSKSFFPMAAHLNEECHQNGCSFFPSATDTRPLAMDWWDVVALIRTDRQLFDQCQRLRAAYTQEGKCGQEYKSIKKLLPALTPCALHDGGRGYEHFVAATGMVQVDLDEVESEDAFNFQFLIEPYDCLNCCPRQIGGIQYWDKAKYTFCCMEGPLSKSARKDCRPAFFQLFIYNLNIIPIFAKRFSTHRYA